MTDYLAESGVQTSESVGTGRHTASVLIIVAFTALAVGDLVLMYLLVRADPPLANRDLLMLGCTGVLIACIAMIVRWQRFGALAARLDDPGPNLGVLGKLLGWFAAVLLPAALYANSWMWAALLLLIVLMSVGLWTRYALVVWAWYVLPILLLGYTAQSVLVALFVMFGPQSMKPYDEGRLAGTLVMAPLWVFLAVKLYRELRAWHRRV